MSDPFDILSQTPPELEKLASLPPYSDESERGILGCVLLDSSACLDDVMQTGITPDWFFDTRHKAIFTAIMEDYTLSKPVEMLSIVDTLKRIGKGDAFGGLSYLSSLQDCGATPSSWSMYHAVIREKWIARRAIDSCTKAITQLREGRNTLESICNLERDIMGIGSECASKKVKTMKEIAHAVSKRIEARFNGEQIGIKTGLHALDRRIEGLKNQQLIVIAGRPSCGKTSMATNIGENIANMWHEWKLKKTVVVFSMEMEDEEIGERMVASDSGVDIKTIGKGMPEGDLKKVMASVVKISRLSPNMIVDDSPGMMISVLVSKARHYHRRNGAGLIIVDYLQLAQGDRKFDNRAAEVDSISVALKRLAKELNIPVIALAQLNRELEKDNKRKPRMSDLKESGGIEQNADVVGILYDPNPADMTDPQAPRQINLRICKQRGGVKDVDVELLFNKTITKFTDIEHRVDDP